MQRSARSEFVPLPLTPLRAPADAGVRRHYMNPAISQYDLVRVIRIRGNRFDGTKVWFARHPAVGDLGTVVECYESRCDVEKGYEVECSDPSTGETIWLDAMFDDELELMSAS